MRCDSMKELLSAMADGEARPEEVRRVEVHLDACQECRARLALLKKMKEAVRSAPVPPMPRALRQALLRRVRPGPRERLADLLDAWKLPLGAAAGACAAAALLLWVKFGEEALPVDVLLDAHSRYALTVTAPEDEVLEDNDNG